MPTIAIPELYEFTDTVPYRPAISILLSLEQMSYAKERVKQSVKQATEEVERHLLEHYPGEMVLLMKEKLRQLIGSINYNSNKKRRAESALPEHIERLALLSSADRQHVFDRRSVRNKPEP